MTVSRNFHMSDPSGLCTRCGASSAYFFGRWFLNMSGGSTMWSSTLIRIMSSWRIAVPLVAALPMKTSFSFRENQHPVILLPQVWPSSRATRPSRWDCAFPHAAQAGGLTFGQLHGNLLSGIENAILSGERRMQVRLTPLPADQWDDEVRGAFKGMLPRDRQNPEGCRDRAVHPRTSPGPDQGVPGLQRLSALPVLAATPDCARWRSCASLTGAAAPTNGSTTSNLPRRRA